MAFAVRRATRKDLSRIVELARELGYTTCLDECAWAADDNARELVLIAHYDHESTVTSEHSSAAIGFVHATLRRSLLGEDFVEIAALVVSETARRRGIGGELLSEVRSWTASQGLSQLRVRSNVVREDAASFYEREGLTRSKQQNVFGTSVEAP